MLREFNRFFFTKEYIVIQFNLKTSCVM